MILDVHGLTKSYRGKEVIHGIDFQVNEGEILCFLGPNGAGKSTTINILTGALGCEAGTVAYNRESIYSNMRKYKQKLGIVPQELALYNDLSAEKNVLFFASLYGLKGKQLKESCRQALEFTGLSSRARDKVNTFSGGMKRRLNIACAIAHRPELLIMDEPTVGIDPQSREYILKGVEHLSSRGMTVVYTTHYMEEVEKISTRILIMDEGNIIAEGSKEELKADVDKERRYHISAHFETAPNVNLFLAIGGVKNAEIRDSEIVIATDKSVEILDEIIAVLISEKIKIEDISCRSASLETVFLNMTGKTLRD